METNKLVQYDEACNYVQKIRKKLNGRQKQIVLRALVASGAQNDPLRQTIAKI